MKAFAQIAAVLLLSASMLAATGCMIVAVEKKSAAAPQQVLPPPPVASAGCAQSGLKPACSPMLQSPNGKLWMLTVDDNGRVAAKPCEPGHCPLDARSVGAPTKYSPDKDTEPIPTVDLGAKK